MILVNNVTKKFKSCVAVDDLSFCVPPKKVTGLIGSNGSGKSTMMRLISTVMKQDSGTIEVCGYNTVSQAKQVRKKIGVMLGGDVSLYGRLTARENILYYAALQNVDQTVAKKRIEELSSIFGMNEYLDRRVAGFSRGMRQKVAFARAVIHEPDVILLDEPSTGLDIVSIKEVQDFIIMCKEKGKTILLSTHNAYEMDRLCDSYVFIDHGQKIIGGDKEMLLKRYCCQNAMELFFAVQGEKKCFLQ